MSAAAIPPAGIPSTRARMSSGGVARRLTSVANGAAEQRQDHEGEPDHSGAEADVGREAAGDAPDQAVVLGAQERPARTDGLGALVLLAWGLLFVCHDRDDEARDPIRLLGMTLGVPQYARGMGQRRIVGSHFNKDG